MTLQPSARGGEPSVGRRNKARAPRWLWHAAWLLALGVVAVFTWRKYAARKEISALASGNGRIEAVEIDIAAKAPGRVEELAVREGDFVSAGQVVAQLDTATLEAQLHQAIAQQRQAESAIATAQSQVLLRESEKTAAEAALAQRSAEHELAQKRLARSSTLARQGATTQQEADDDRARVESTAAAIRATRAEIAATAAGIAAARAQVIGAGAQLEAAQASVERIRADIADMTLRAPRDGRVQYLVAQAGEVVGAGGRVVSMVDLSDVYMTFFLPTAAAGKLALGSEVRLVIDAFPEYVVPARVSFIADVAQFTPKTVETELEREKMMFRVRARIAPELLRKHISQVKTGLPGRAYVKLDAAAEWPAQLRVNLPP